MLWAPCRRTIAAVFAAWSFVVQEEPAALHACAMHDGVAHVAGPGILTVRGELADGLLRLTVENTGTLGGAPESPSRLGLANVRDRLRLLYGDRASVHLEGADDRVRATVLIPASR